MADYKPPIALNFVWNTADDTIVKPIVDYCYTLLSRNIKHPFSRSMNLPIFLYRSGSKKSPPQIHMKAKKTLVFIFVGKEIVCNEIWVEYIKSICVHDSVDVIPIAIDKLGLQLTREFDNKNFIRMYEFNEVFLHDYTFISIAHEIYRWALYESNGETRTGDERALKIFISHAKDGKNGIKLALKLKDFISDSSMKKFFDATDIAPGYKFVEEILEHIKGSTIVAIHSDLYSSRYWCQREIICAKENNRPMITVDALEEFEDRVFPFSANIPCVHVKIENDVTEKDLLRILSSALLETIRFQYSKQVLNQYKSIGLIDKDTEIIARPPEVSDIRKMFYREEDLIKKRGKSFIYPEPFIYNEELAFLSELGIEFFTPLTINTVDLSDVKIGISISELSEDELIDIAQDKKHLLQISQDFARHFLARNATVIYGGDLRPKDSNGFTEFLFDEARILQTRTLKEKISIDNYIAWPIYNKDTIDMKEWKARNYPVANMIEHPLPEDVFDLVSEEKRGIFLTPDNVTNKYIWSRCLTDMREKMILNSDVRICAGGRIAGYKGRMPGVLEEIIITMEMEKPLFLIGGFGGVTSKVCSFLANNEIPTELTLKWQIENNPNYKELVEFVEIRGGIDPIDYNQLLQKLKIENLNNGLSKKDNIKLFNTPFIDEALYLVLKGINCIYHQ